MASTRTPTLVFASTYRQFNYWLRLNGYKPTDYMYIHQEYRMHGYNRDNPVIFLQLLDDIPLLTRFLHYEMRHRAEGRFDNITREYT